MTNRVAIQGFQGSYSHQSVNQIYSENYELVECSTFDGLFEKLAAGEAQLAVCPIENSIAGTIIQTYDLIRRYPSITVIGEHYLRIELQLIAYPGTVLSQVETVYSHPMALRQCQKYLQQHGIKAVESEDTAGSVEQVMNMGTGSHAAAVAGEMAAKLYGGEILAHNIETDKQNYTRFWILSTKQELIDSANKASVVFATKHEVGALAQVLNKFLEHGLNLTKLESRPMVGTPWQYHFYCDLVTDAPQQLSSQLAAIKESGVCKDWRVLGMYRMKEF